VPNPTGRAVALGISALGLLSLVALASQAPLMRTRTHARRGYLPGWTTAIFALVIVISVVVFAYGIAVIRRDSRPKRVVGLWSVLIVVAIAVVASLVMHSHRHRTPTMPEKAAAAHTPPTGLRPRRPSPRPVGLATTRLEVVILASAAFAALGAATRPRRHLAGSRPADMLGVLLDGSLEDLRAEPDPRKAVIAAYARMERGLGASGLARAPAETSLEYLRRVLAHRRVSPAAVSRLTDLFEQAKFSDHTIGPQSKAEAIAALEAVRDELRAGLVATAGQVSELETAVAG
jgi:hypothetical protein